MSVNKSLQAVLAPQVTEKATMVADKHNQIAFKVKKDATKMQQITNTILMIRPAAFRMNEETAVNAALELEKVQNYTSQGSIVKTIYVPNRLLNFVVK